MRRNHRDATHRKIRRSSRSKRQAVWLTIDALDSRTLLSNVSWTGQGDGKSWTDASNWSGGKVPVAADDVTINLGGNPTIQIGSGSQSVHSVTSSDPLSISGGALAVAANSTLSGGLTMTGGSLGASGTGVTLSVSGATSIAGASLSAQGSATLTLPQLTSYVSDNSTFQATGAASVLDVSAVTTVTQQLDPSLDWSTLQLGSLGFGSINVNVPPGLTEYQTTVSYQNFDGTSLNVLVALNFNVQTGLLTVAYTSLDPITGQAPTGVTDGFLPPDDSNGIGEGYVQYTIQPRAGLPTGTVINQQASVVFDINAPINTAPAINTVDVNTPSSSVAPLPATETSPSFPVSWSGSDGDGSGIASYDIYVSDGGGPYQPWQSNTTQTSATYTGQNGHTYSFYSVATTNVGLVQPTPNASQATTAVRATSQSPTPGQSPGPTPTPPATPPAITSEQAIFTRKLNNKHKPVGKPTLTGFRFTFSDAMDPAAAGNPANYRVDWASTKRVKRKTVQILHPVPISVNYDAADDSVSLLLNGKSTFAKGGQITVIAAPPSGVTSASGVLLDGNDEGQAGDNGVFTIMPKASGIKRG